MEHILIEFNAYRSVRWSPDEEEVQSDYSPLRVAVNPSHIARIEEWILGEYYRIVMTNGDTYFVDKAWYERIISILNVLTIDPNGRWSDRHIALELQAAIIAEKAQAEKERAEEEKEPEPCAGIFDDPEM